jgi:catechol 2,3-dioxygenase-like lactoylglutathione lyase family enzyme
LEAVTFDVVDAAAVAAFWGAVLDRDVVDEYGGALVPGDSTQVGLRFVSSADQPGRRRLHVHLTSTSLEDQERTVETALRLGARRIDVGQGPDEKHVVLADPGGNELCVIEPGNTFLAGTGYLGEVTCDGSRDVGIFWRDALGWRLVWDQGAQTAIQSPLGGTKISWDSWGGSPPGSRAAGSGQRFDLLAADPISESRRLVSLGATRLPDSSDGFDLTDPDGNAFGLRPG